MKYKEYTNWIKSRNENVTDFASSVDIGEGMELVVSADGVGTKLLVARELGIFDTVGVDLVAMNVNDLLTKGANPVGFSNYIACGELKSYLKEVIKGIELGCELSNCKLLGGETAIMGDMYEPDDFDLAGFAIGTVHKNHSLPKKEWMKAGDPIYGLKSSGIHSNGLTIARKVIPKKDWEKILIPTKIYVRDFEKLYSSNILGVAHITGDGFTKIDSILPDHLKANLYYDWEVPEIFMDIQDRTKFSHEEMTKNFNLGIGMVVATSKDYVNKSNMIKIGELSEKKI